MNGETLILADPAAVAEATARRLVDLMAATDGRFSLALSGGSTPQRLYRLLASAEWRGQIDWHRLHLFLADERFLPLDHADSNFHMLTETLLDPLAAAGVAIPAANLHPMPTDGSVEDSARRYEAELRQFFGAAPPRFDLIILGMGPDGHTASLFPGHVHAAGPWVLPVHDSPKPPPTRLSLSLQLINHARQVWFLVTGQDKAAALSALRSDSEPVLPAGTVRPEPGELLWLVDQAAWA
ncbi:MAG: 6-phosphogluconolactonase [Candidatus Methylumidiphilus sp.]